MGTNLKDPETGERRDGGKLGRDHLPKSIDDAKERIKLVFKYKEEYDRDAIEYVITEL